VRAGLTDTPGLFKCFKGGEHGASVRYNPQDHHTCDSFSLSFFMKVLVVTELSKLEGMSFRDTLETFCVKQLA